MSATARWALQDISATPRTRPVRGVNSVSNVQMIPDSYLTPSPDEQIIRSRSRLSLDSGYLSGKRFQTPTSDECYCLDEICSCMQDKSSDSPVKMFSLQSTRKRLLLSPEKVTKPKKARTGVKTKQVPLGTELRGLTQEQLVALFDQLLIKHPNVEQDIRDLMPPPDLSPLQERLRYLQKNIFKSFPNTRWGSSRDAFCYRRVRTHLEAFKKACVEQGRGLVQAQCWVAVIDYVLMAWKYVDQMPVWEDPSHNASKNQAFRNLASQCMTALKKSHFEKEKYRDICTRLEAAVKVNAEIQPCVAHINAKLLKLT